MSCVISGASKHPHANIMILICSHKTSLTTFWYGDQRSSGSPATFHTKMLVLNFLDCYGRRHSGGFFLSWFGRSPVVSKKFSSLILTVSSFLLFNFHLPQSWNCANTLTSSQWTREQRLCLPTNVTGYNQQERPAVVGLVCFQLDETDGRWFLS